MIDKFLDKLRRDWPESLKTRYWAGMAAILLLVLLFASIYWAECIWLYNGSTKWGGDSTRSVLFALGGIAALYGLIVARRRLDEAQKAQFSETLAQGVQSLANENLTIRTSGVRVLENLAKSVEVESGEHDIICNILNDFIRERTSPPREELGKPQLAKLFDKRASITLAIRVLAEIVPKAVFIRNIVLYGLDLRGLHLDRLNLQRAQLWRVNLQNVGLSDTNLEGAFMGLAYLQGADLRGANFEDADLDKADVTGAKLQGATNLTEEHLAQIIYKDGSPPDLSLELVAPPHRAYKWGKKKGKKCRRFVKSKEKHSLKWIDETSPLWEHIP